MAANMAVTEDQDGLGDNMASPNTEVFMRRLWLGCWHKSRLFECRRDFK